MRATIKDIAAETGFSVTTISLVLNGKGYKISDETKNQILAKARELNYRPNQLAVSLVKRQSKTIGFIVPDISNVYFANMARAIDEACRENGWSVILCNTNDNYDRDREYMDLLADKGADGIVFLMATGGLPASWDRMRPRWIRRRVTMATAGRWRRREFRWMNVSSVSASIRRRAARRQSNSSFHRILRRFSPATMLQRMAYAENSRNIERKCRKMFRSSDTMTFSMPGCWRCR